MLIQIYQVYFLIIPLCLGSKYSSKSCVEVKLEHEKDCLKYEYGNYVNCVRTRMKRQSYDCENDTGCYDCVCDSCSYSVCGGECNKCCNSCCRNYVQCHTNHCCHKQCHGECRTYSCRSSCRRSCYENIAHDSSKEVDNAIVERTVIRTIIQEGSNSTIKSNTTNKNSHNITTVINLKNFINNTNFIDVPVNLSYTNKNNISLFDEDGYRKGSCNSDGSGSDNCCIVIGPKQCVPTLTSPYMRCFHTRSRQCGVYCTAEIVHQEPTQICDKFDNFGQPICQQQMAFIPQPKPICTYTDTWPYVACGIQPTAECKGCYEHYFNPQAKEYKSCPQQCYNDFGAGPLYRQGPVYQPSYSYTPPCYLTPQGCGGATGFGGTVPYGGILSGIMPGAGFGYGPAQLPFAQPGFPLPPSIQFYPPILRAPPDFTSNQASINISDLLEPQIVNTYQEDGPFLPTYEIPRKDVEIQVEITDPKKN